MDTPYDHVTNDCKVLKNQVKNMKAMYTAQTPQERKRIQEDSEPFSRKEIHAMVGDAVKAEIKPMFEEMFSTYVKQAAKRK